MNCYKILICGIAACGMLATSCSKHEPELRSDNNVRAFAIVTDKATNQSHFDSDMRMLVSTEYYGRTMGVNIENVNVAGREVSFSVKEAPCTVTSEGTMVLKATDIKAGENVINTFVCNSYGRIGSTGQTQAIYTTRFSVDNAWDVRVVENSARLYGKTVIETIGQSGAYSTYEPEYVLRFNVETMKADLTIYNAKFDPKMPQAFDMIFGDIPFTMNQNGYSLGIDRLIPTIGDKPYERYEITDLTITGNFISNTMTVSFTCAGRYKANAQVGPYIKQQQ